MAAGGGAGGDPTGAGHEPQHHVRLPVLRQTWSAVSFLHWRFDRADLLALVPDELDVAEQEDTAWVSMVLFCASDTTGPVPGPTLPPFAETNLRTYVRTEDGREGIWFLDLEAGSAITTAGGNLVYGVPYHRAEATVEVAPEAVTYRSTRDGGAVGHDIEIRTGAHYTSPERKPLDEWLTGRWRAISVNAGIAMEAFVEHEPWPLRYGSVHRLAENVLASVGLRRPDEAPLVHCADEVHVRLGPPKPLRP